MAHLAARQWVELGWVVIRHARGGAQRQCEVIEIGCGVHREGARQSGGRGCIDAGDPRMRPVAAAERDVQRARHEAVVGESALPRQEPRILDPLHPRADVARPQCEGHSCRAFTARTALTMFS